MTKFEQIRAAHNATKAKWQRARELAAQHLEERKQREMERESSRRSSKASTLAEEIAELNRRTQELAGTQSAGMKEFAPRARLQSKESITTAASSRYGSKEAPCRTPQGGSPILEEETEDPRRFLWRFGYFRGPPQPELQVDITGHSEYQSGSWLPGQDKEEYAISCTLRWESSADSRVLEWKTKMRLTAMRSRLHDRIKKEMGAEYNELFRDARFAHHGGMPGTAARLRNWFQTLTAQANQGHLKTELLALLLRELQVPIPEKSDVELGELQHLLVAPVSPTLSPSSTKLQSPARHEHDVPSEPEVPLSPYPNKHGPFVTQAQQVVVAL